MIYYFTGFISIDCGITENMTYTDKTTELNYVSESGFIENNIGERHTISLEYHFNTLDQQFSTLRSFPQGDKNCYTLRPGDGKGNKYLIRARFLYGNYDGRMTLPVFDLYLGANKWSSVKFDNANISLTKEIIHIPSSDYIFVCVVNTGHGTPFISALELRPLKNSTYTSATAAVLYRRLDVGSTSNISVRYKDDVYDRIWQPFNFPERKVLSTPLTIDSSSNIYQPPSSVMSTAMSPAKVSNPMFAFHMKPDDPTAEYYVYMHFAELEKLKANESREFFIYENLELWNVDNQPFSPQYLSTTTLFNVALAPISGDQIDYTLFKTTASTHQPTLNAFEVYIVQNFSQPQTHEQDVGAMLNIKSMYGVQKNWQGDPCSPKSYTWEGLNCSFNGQDPVRIISLDLSSSGLEGEIASYISNLTMIQSIDLSNNSLSGSVPEFLSRLPFLKVLDMRGNNLTGSVPSELIEKSKSGSLLLSVSDNPDLCSSLSCRKKNKKYIVPIIASVATLFVLLLAFFIIWKVIKGRKRGT
ncbi:putative leucine-rich repeat receptor-like protein kinase At2g19210 [Cannabis sativa]|uniref:putative leucine-rich repeat receptor-like protein kinase At2g19210 n=1 Tax=Cannabis sativa TaxID=3483 RepID=UPI0029CA8734|nr:putative leucine-rich repeat receptor-like protein kinase At2g19210 [Cannabis sativa]